MCEFSYIKEEAQTHTYAQLNRDILMASVALRTRTYVHSLEFSRELMVRRA